MLLTRCPECDTTFRVTDETLKKASGQVRCGRCASVFNAYVELQDAGGKPLDADAPRGQAQKPPLAARVPEQAPPAHGAAARAETKRASDDSAASVGTAAVADILASAGKDAETRVPAEDAATEARAGAARDRSAISATEVDRVLANETAEPVPYVWLH